MNRIQLEEQEINAVSNGGIGFFGLLGLMFIGLKLTGYIDWSWWLVLSPIWVPIAVVIALVVGMALYMTKNS